MMLLNLINERVNQLVIMSIIDPQVANRRDEWIEIGRILQEMDVNDRP